jgi:hypothetical protein
MVKTVQTAVVRVKFLVQIVTETVRLIVLNVTETGIVSAVSVVVMVD